MKKLTIVFSLLMLAGCAGARIKDAQKQILGDISTIIQNGGDCQFACESLKAYVASKGAELAK